MTEENKTIMKATAIAVPTFMFFMLIGAFSMIRVNKMRRASRVGDMTEFERHYKRIKINGIIVLIFYVVVFIVSAICG